MIRYTQKALRELVARGIAKDITAAGVDDYKDMIKTEGSFNQVGYSAGVYGCNGLLIQGEATKTLYAVCARATAIFIFG